MSKHPELPWIIPYLTVSDPEKSVAAYKALGFFTYGDPVRDETGKIVHMELQYMHQNILFGPEGAYGATAKTPANQGTPSPVGIYLYCDSTDTLFRQAIDAGFTEVDAPAQMFWGDRVARVMDRDGYVWTLATKTHSYTPPNSGGTSPPL